MTSRLRILKIVFTLGVVGIWLRLAWWQAVVASDLRLQAQLQRTTSLQLPASRGQIRARDGFPLVANQESYLVYADPQKFRADREAVLRLWELVPPASTSALFSQPTQVADLSWVPLAHQISRQAKEKIEQLGLAGLGFEPEPARMYPEGTTSAHLVGFVGQDENGLPTGYFGLEGYYNRQLSGKPGRVTLEQDALNRPILIGSQNRILPQPGADLVTSVDRTIQFIAFTKLAAALERYGATAGTVTVMEPSTGKILAMVSLPGYDPGQYARFPSDLYKNPVISESYEPGSTFKVIVMAAALDAQVVQPDTRCDKCSGPRSVSGYTIRTWNDKYYPVSTMTEVIQHSDNIGMVWVGQKLGERRLLGYLKKFGFGQSTGVDLQEESAPELREQSQWRDIDLATASFGQGIAVTPLQMVRAVGVLANMGKLPTPHVVDQTVTSGRSRPVNQPKLRPGVISTAAAAQITQMMINSVNRGEAKWAKPEGFLIAGKTGTAQIPVAGHYDQEKTIASFVGFAPADDPQFVMLVTLREPQTSPWGSETAAPLWFDIAKEIFRYLKIGPSRFD